MFFSWIEVQGLGFKSFEAISNQNIQRFGGRRFNHTVEVIFVVFTSWRYLACKGFRFLLLVHGFIFQDLGLRS